MQQSQVAASTAHTKMVIDLWVWEVTGGSSLHSGTSPHSNTHVASYRCKHQDGIQGSSKTHSYQCGKKSGANSRCQVVHGPCCTRHRVSTRKSTCDASVRRLSATLHGARAQEGALLTAAAQLPTQHRCCPAAGCCGSATSRGADCWRQCRRLILHPLCWSSSWLQPAAEWTLSPAA